MTKDLQSLTKHCHSLWLSDGVDLQFFVPLALFSNEEPEAAGASDFYWMDIRGFSDTEL